VSDNDQALYVYGVVAAADAPNVNAPGVKGADVRIVHHEDFAVLVSETDRGPLAAAREVRAHWRVLEEAGEKATVLPVRFGTVMESETAVKEDLLAPNVERLTALLRELAGRVQLNVKGLYDEERLLRDIVRRTPAIARLRERVRGLPKSAGYYDSIQLGELVAAEVEHCREQDSALALERLEPHAAAARREPPAGTDTAFSASFLVERERVEDFSAAVSRLGKEIDGRMQIRYVGPLPPYSFADADLTARSEAWA